MQRIVATIKLVAASAVERKPLTNSMVSGAVKGFAGAGESLALIRRDLESKIFCEWR